MTQGWSRDEGEQLSIWWVYCKKFNLTLGKIWIIVWSFSEYVGKGCGSKGMLHLPTPPPWLHVINLSRMPWLPTYVPTLKSLWPEFWVFWTKILFKISLSLYIYIFKPLPYKNNMVCLSIRRIHGDRFHGHTYTICKIWKSLMACRK